MSASSVTIAVRSPPMSSVTSATPHRPPAAAERDRHGKEARQQRRRQHDQARASPGRGVVEAAPAAGPLASAHATQDEGFRHVLDVRQGVTSRHEPSSVTRDDAMQAERPRRRLIAYYIADADGCRGQRPDVQEVAVAQEGQHAVAARAQAQRVAASQEGAGQLLEPGGRNRRAQGAIRSKRRRAIGASSSSRKTSAHHSPKREESTMLEPATGTRVTTLTGRRSPVKLLAKRW